MVIIQGAKFPFVFASNTQPVSITGVHFAESERFAIKIQSVNGLKITNCKITKTKPVDVSVPPKNDTTFPVAGGIASEKVQGQVITGDVSIVGNEIDIGVTDDLARTFGIQLIQTAQANVAISGNTVKNVTAHGIVLRDIVGTALITGNTITTGEVVAGIRISRTTSLMASCARAQPQKSIQSQTT